MAKINNPIRRWVSRGIVAAGVAWIVVVFLGEAAELKQDFVVESYAWLGFTIVAGCIALLITVPIFRTMLVIHTGSLLSLGPVARLFFVAQMLRHLPGRFWGVMFLVNETLDEVSATAMVRANIDFMFYSIAFNLLTAGFLVTAVTVDATIALLLAILGIATLCFALQADLLGRIAARFGRLLPSRLREFTGAAVRPHIPWASAIKVSVLFVLVWLCYLCVWWAFPKIFAVLDEVNIWLLCASYSLAWVIGYVSMITPGGLGVREAGFFALASPLMGLAELTFLAVFIRVWQILIESLMFVAFAFLKPPGTGAAHDEARTRSAQESGLS